ncbi:MAG: CpaE family protein [Beijerinckiaceae bacterium]
MLIRMLWKHEDGDLAQSIIDTVAINETRIEPLKSIEDARARLAHPSEYAVLVILSPVAPPGEIETVIELAGDCRERAYVVYVTDDVAASDFRRLLATGSGEWMPTRSVETELPTLLQRIERANANPSGVSGRLFTSFSPSGGGAGNSTLVIETAAALASKLRGDAPRVCIVDLDTERGNVCDLLDVAPQLDLGAIAVDPNRIDDQLLSAFRSSTTYGVDVYATPKFTMEPSKAPANAVYALCNALAQRYEFVNADLPFYLYPWVEEIIRNSDVAVITCDFSVPSALRVGALFQNMEGRSLRHPNTWIAINKARRSIFGRALSGKELESALPPGRRFYIPDDPVFAAECANIGRPMVTVSRRKPVSRAAIALADALVARRDAKMNISRTSSTGRQKRRIFGIEW